MTLIHENLFDDNQLGSDTSNSLSVEIEEESDENDTYSRDVIKMKNPPIRSGNRSKNSTNSKGSRKLRYAKLNKQVERINSKNETNDQTIINRFTNFTLDQINTT